MNRDMEDNTSKTGELGKYDQHEGQTSQPHHPYCRSRAILPAIRAHEQKDYLLNFLASLATQQ